ncbi:hypothetical protein K456DRAFT_1582914 [Colletotrichum gloeosporioides 23]|nr:hypothetical protein K456DRAFT_1582914 [Colletotrichum gloeosporioides 23]
MSQLISTPRFEIPRGQKHEWMAISAKPNSPSAVQISALVKSLSVPAKTMYFAVVEKHAVLNTYAMTPVELGIISGLGGTLFLMVVLLCSVCSIRRDQKRSHSTSYGVSP